MGPNPMILVNVQNDYIVEFLEVMNLGSVLGGLGILIRSGEVFDIGLI